MLGVSRGGTVNTSISAGMRTTSLCGTSIRNSSVWRSNGAEKGLNAAGITHWSFAVAGNSGGFALESVGVLNIPKLIRSMGEMRKMRSTVGLLPKMKSEAREG